MHDSLKPAATSHLSFQTTNSSTPRETARETVVNVNVAKVSANIRNSLNDVGGIGCHTLVDENHHPDTGERRHDAGRGRNPEQMLFIRRGAQETDQQPGENEHDAQIVELPTNAPCTSYPWHEPPRTFGLVTTGAHRDAPHAFGIRVAPVGNSDLGRNIIELQLMRKYQPTV